MVQIPNKKNQPVRDNPAPRRYRNENARLWLYFIGLQLFLFLMIYGFSNGGPIVFGVLIGVPPFLAWFSGRRSGYQFIFYFACVLFAVGQRTIYVGEHVRFVPSEVLYWVLAFTAMAVPMGPKGSSGPFCPRSLVVLSIAAAWGVVLSQINKADMNLALGYAKEIWLSIPVFFVCSRFIVRNSQFETVVKLLTVESFFLSFLTIAEYYDLGIIRVFSGFMEHRELMTSMGFRRAYSTFWGNPMLAAIIAMWFPLILMMWVISKKGTQRVVIALSLALSVLCIYFTANRGVWLPWAFSVLLFFYLRGVKGKFVMILVVIFGLISIPQAAKSRMQETFGETRESGTSKRIERAQYATDLILKSPLLGNGWGASGLVHSDWLQLWADTGILSVLALIAMYVKILLRLVRVNKQFRDDSLNPFGRPLLLSVLTGGVIIMIEPFFNLPEQYPSFWTILAIAYLYPNIIMRELNERMAVAT